MASSKKKKYDGQFKERAVKLARERGSAAQAARELGIGYSLLRSWMLAADVAESKGRGLEMALQEKKELERLRKQVADQAEELEVLKKATAYFARERLVRNTPGSKK